MKRIVLAVLIILTLSISVVYASNIEVGVRAVPYEISKYIELQRDFSLTSVQGFGGYTGVKYVFKSGFDVGVDIGLDSCTYQTSRGYHTDFDGTIHAIAGIATPIDARLGFSLDFGFGIDINSDPDSGLQTSASAKADLGLRMKCLENTDGFALVFGGAFKVTWEADKWLAYAFTPYFGVDCQI